MLRYKALFRVLQKVIGLWLVIQGMLRIAADLLSFVWTWAREASGLPMPAGWGSMSDFNLLDFTFGTISNGGLELLLGLYLFFGAAWIVNLAMLGSHRQCVECGYDFGPNEVKRCPECGTAVERGDVLARERCAVKRASTSARPPGDGD